MNTGEYRCFCPFHPVPSYRLKQQHLLRSRGSYWLRFTRALQKYKKIQLLSVRVCVSFPFVLDSKFVGHTSRGHTGFLIHLPSAVRALLYFARRIQPFFSLVDREVEFYVLTIYSFSTCWAFLFLFFSEKNPVYRDSNSCPNVSEGHEVTSELPRRPVTSN